MTSTPTLPIFVYGTLQRGKERASLWPHPAERIEWAMVEGTLYDLGPYPALVPGHFKVRGELWHLAPKHLAKTLTVLDRVEGFSQPCTEIWYRREIVVCYPDEQESCDAYTYFYARTDELTDAMIVRPDSSGKCHWQHVPEE